MTYLIAVSAVVVSQIILANVALLLLLDKSRELTE